MSVLSLGRRRNGGSSSLPKLLNRHFEGLPIDRIATASRDFPSTARVDVQAALEDSLQNRPQTKLLGVSSEHGHQTMMLASLMTEGGFPVRVGPLQYDELDIGDPEPTRCLQNGLWLSKNERMPSVLLLAPAVMHGMSSGVHVEIAMPQGAAGAQFSQEYFRQLELAAGSGRTYRGRVLSLEAFQHFSGLGGTVKVHRLRAVKREEIVLPPKTLKLLDRNVVDFIAKREGIRGLDFSAKKGLLFYGPPGTGKTHTIHYLASQLPGHTTLLVTAEQVAIIGEYCRLARFLQPSLVIIEDVDLIARERSLQTPGQESLLNKLLNEMDGLREDADVLFVLTTNRPEQLEPALASRPGRIDQAIEFPLPDEDGRYRLASLYARKLDVPKAVMDLIVRRTSGCSPAFIKELMRRSAQFQMELLDAPAPHALQESAVNAAIEEMVFAGGSLNVKLLGGAANWLSSSPD